MKQKGIMFLVGMVCFLGISTKQSFATHAAGMDMFYRWTNDSTYQFTVIFFRNCQGFTAPAPPSMTVTAKANSISQNFTFTCTKLPVSGAGVPALEPSNMYNCTEETALCYEEHVYRGNWTSRGRAQDWIFSTSVCCRPGPPPFANAPENINYTDQWIECGLNNLDFPDQVSQNWSPLWHNRRPNHPGYTTDTVINYLFRTLCMGNYYTLDQSVREYQGDSISYEFFVPQGGGGNNVVYRNTNINNVPYSFMNPLPLAPSTGPLTINPVTGIIPITPGQPTGTGVYVIGIRAREWRYDTIVSGSSFVRVAKQIGFNNRDMTIWIDDVTTCRRDSVHPKDIVIDLTGETNVDQIDVFFSNGVTGDPNSLVRCNSISPDGSEFRILDSTNYVAPFDSTVRSIGIHMATWTCQAGLTEKVTLHLSESLKCQEYTLMLKKGTDLDVLESECGFLEPEFTTGILTVTKNVQVDIDTVRSNNLLSYCLPTENPFPKLRATSKDSTSFPLDYYWAYKCIGCTTYDTIEGQEVPYMWAKEPGAYEVRVRDPLNCAGYENINVVWDTNPEFFVNVQDYCDRYGVPAGMPEFVAAPHNDHPEINLWEWRGSFGPAGVGDTLKGANLVEGIKYTLKGTKPPIVPGAKRCSYEFDFVFSRDSFPPQDELFVTFLEDGMELCITDGDTGEIQVWQQGIRDKYSPMYVQWYKDTTAIPGQGYSLIVTDTGRYIVHVEDSLGCWNRDTTIVTHDERLAAPVVPCTVSGSEGIFTFEWPEDSPVIGNEVSLDGGLTWSNTSNGNIHIVYNIENQKFIMARGRVDGACDYTLESVSLECPDEVFPPNVMTPNGDGLNDLFIIRGLELYEDSKVEVFDRWGTKVYTNSNYKNDWDGGDLPDGTYYYILDVDDPQGTVHKGILTILR